MLIECSSNNNIEHGLVSSNSSYFIVVRVIMGLKGGTNAFWKARNVTYQDLVVIHQKLFHKSLPIHIDVDVSILYMSVLNDPKHAYAQIFTEIANRLVEISSCGFEVTLVFDGLERHHSKRDSWNRRTRKLICQAKG